jgi:shikimate dehydrogenase
MTQKQYGVIGKPLSHSLSPALHNFWFKRNNLKASYSLIEIEENQISNIINKIRTKELHGINVTVPYKKAVIPFLDLIINDAEATSSVNTIYLDNDNKVVGENTDVYGFEQSFINKFNENNFIEKKFLILGSGGAALSLIHAIVKKKIKKIFISNRSVQETENIKKRFPFIEIVPWEKFNQGVDEMDVIINATSLGMKNSTDFKEPITNFKSSLIYYDIIYNPLETNMIKNFRENKIRTFNGLEMFLYQGQKSFFLWNNIKPLVDEELKNKIISNLK